MNEAAKLSLLDEKVRELCWGTKYRNTPLPVAAVALTDWAHTNGWPAMTDEQARDVLVNEGEYKHLRPRPASATAADRVAAFLDARAGMSNVDQAEVMTIYRNDQRHVLTVADLRALIESAG